MRFILAGILFFAAPFTGAAADWPPVNPTDLALKQPKVDKDADAEALLWEVRVLDEADGGTVRAVQNHYLRVKIFTDRGRDKYSTVDISYFGRNKVSGIAGRTIKSNGDVVELTKDAVYERTLVKAGGQKVKAKSFAMPAVEAGSIIEYRWKETLNDHLTNYTRLEFQREIPVHLVRYYVKPFSNPEFPYGMRSLAFHFQAHPFSKEKDNFYMMYAENIPAFKEEPDMPAEANVRPWMLLYYSPDTKLTAEKYWDNTGKEIYSRYKSRIKISDEMKRTADEVVQGSSTPEEKARKLYEWVRKQYKNASYSGDLTNQERERVKQNKNTSDTFKQKAGSGYEISLLYVALATAVDLDARMTRSGDRQYGAFDKDFTDDYFLSTYSVAVKLGDQWKFCDPASMFLPFGMLRWQEEGQPALVSDPKQPSFTTTPLAPPTDSFSSRQGTFRLSEDGTLEGDVRVGYTGHPAVVRKWNYQDQSPEEREEAVKEGIKDRFGGAEMTNVKVEGAQDPLKPFVITYHVKIPGYAQRTGRRLFLKAAYFHRDFAPRFSSSGRKFPIMFQYGWSEQDRITFTLPEGFSLEKAEAPAPLRIADVGDQTVKLFISKDNRTLSYERDFVFGKRGALAYPVGSYSALKAAFDRVQEMDDHVLTLRQDAAGGQ